MAKKILLIINNPQVQKPFAKFLQELNYKIFVCEDGKSAIEIVTSFKPDLILCQASLPVISGTEVARLFKSHDKISTIPFILITSKMPTFEEMERADFRISADDFIQLPLDQPALYGIITKWLESDERPKSIAERMAGELRGNQPIKRSKSWKKGRVNCSTLCKLLFTLIQNNETGSIRFQGQKRKMTVFVKNGVICDVTSNYIREDTLGHFLLQTNKITMQENSSSLQRAKKSNTPQGKVLISMGVLTQKDLEQVLTQQKKMKFLRLFQGSWNGSAFQFVPQEVNIENFTMNRVKLSDMIKMGLFKIVRKDELYNIFVKHNKTQTKFSISSNFLNITSLLHLESSIINKARALDGQTIDGLKMSIPGQFDDLLRLSFLVIITKAAYFQSEKDRGGISENSPDPSPVKKGEIGIELGKEVGAPFKKWDSDAYHEKLSSARTYIRSNLFQKAKPLLEDSLRINPISSEALALLALTTFKLDGKNDLASVHSAKEMLKKAINIDDFNDSAYQYLGRIFLKEGKILLAENYFKKALEINPSNVEAKHDLSLLLKKKRKMRNV